ncbi:MAG TPA: HAMP domain-containing protein, partial [Acidimicrobiia bacterium]|nr:HAMP domain-containing protein [Acidimicrobiia bacterium]
MSMRTSGRRTIRLRLTLLYGALFLASGIALLAVTYGLVSHATANEVVVSKGPNGSTGVFIGSGSSPAAAPGPMVGTKTLNGGLQAGGSSVGIGNLTPRQLETQAVELRRQAVQQHANELHQLLEQSSIALAIMSLISIALGWMVAGRVLRPLRTITTAARERSATTLHERLALDGPNDELKELGDT